MINILLPKIKKEFVFQENKLYTFLNPYSYLIARDRIDIIKPIDIIHTDGIVLSLLFSILGIKKTDRYSFDMTSVAKIVFEICEKKGFSIVMVGTEPNVIDDAIKNILKVYNLNIIDYRNGYFSSDEERLEYQTQIKKLNPDVLIVGMGVVRQENFLIEMRKLGWSKTGFTCGGFLHQVAVQVEYYPEIMNKLHLRWAYRIYKEPKLLRRYTIDYSKFLIKFFQDFSRWKRNKNITDS